MIDILSRGTGLGFKVGQQYHKHRVGGCMWAAADER